MFDPCQVIGPPLNIYVKLPDFNKYLNLKKVCPNPVRYQSQSVHNPQATIPRGRESRVPQIVITVKFCFM